MLYKVYLTSLSNYINKAGCTAIVKYNQGCTAIVKYTPYFDDNTFTKLSPNQNHHVILCYIHSVVSTVKL